MTGNQHKKQRPIFKTFADLLQRLICIVARFVFKKIYGEKGEKVPPVENLLLLDPASVLAMKIRTRKVTSVDVVKAFIERIKVRKL